MLYSKYNIQRGPDAVSHRSGTAMLKICQKTVISVDFDE